MSPAYCYILIGLHMKKLIQPSHTEDIAMLSQVLPFQQSKIESILQVWIQQYEYGDYHLMDMAYFHQWVSIQVFEYYNIILTNLLQIHP